MKIEDKALSTVPQYMVNRLDTITNSNSGNIPQ